METLRKMLAYEDLMRITGWSRSTVKKKAKEGAFGEKVPLDDSGRNVRFYEDNMRAFQAKRDQVAPAAMQRMRAASNLPKTTAGQKPSGSTRAKDGVPVGAIRAMYERHVRETCCPPAMVEGLQRAGLSLDKRSASDFFQQEISMRQLIGPDYDSELGDDSGPGA